MTFPPHIGIKQMPENPPESLGMPPTEGLGSRQPLNQYSNRRVDKDSHVHAVSTFSMSMVKIDGLSSSRLGPGTFLVRRLISPGIASRMSLFPQVLSPTDPDFHARHHHSGSTAFAID